MRKVSFKQIVTYSGWLLAICFLILSCWLVGRVNKWKGDTWAARLFPERAFAREQEQLVSQPDEWWLVGDSRVSQWPLQYFPDEYQVRRFGRSGWTSRELLDALENRLESDKPKGVILQMGFNDFYAIGFRPEMRGAVSQKSRQNVVEIVAKCRESHLQVIILSTIVRGGLDWRNRLTWSSILDDEIAAFNQFLMSLEKEGVRTIDVNSVLIGEDSLIRPEFCSDAFHLNQDGYRAIGNLLLEEKSR